MENTTTERLTPDHLIAATQVFAHASVATGGSVVIRPEWGCLPVLIGTDGQPVALCLLVEEIGGLIDYERVKDAFPTLSYSQIASAFSFLRKLTMFNTASVDLDALQDADVEPDSAFPAAMRTALSNWQ